MPSTTLVLIPGLMCDHAVWEPVIPALPADTVVADHGLADSLPRMAQQILERVPGRIAVAGHSMGARVALEVLRQAPDRVSAVALLDSGFQPRAPGAAGQEEEAKRMALLRIAREQGVRAMAAEWVKGMVHPDRLQDEALIDDILAMFERKTADVFERQIRALLARPDGSEVLRSIRVPALVACGRQDSWAPVSQHEAMHALIPAARLEFYEDAGHMAPMERPAVVAASLVRWLEQAGD